MNILQFMSDSPFLTFFCVWLICECIASSVKHIFVAKKQPLVPDCCKCEIKRMADHISKRK